jgi:hypothetical protein
MYHPFGPTKICCKLVLCCKQQACRNNPTERERTQMIWSALVDCLWVLLLVSGASCVARLAFGNQQREQL